MAHLQAVTEASARSDPRSPASTQHELIKEAEKNDEWDRGSITKSYHRLRVEELTDFVDGLKENQREKLKIDARRVKRCRAKLAESGANRLLLSEVQESFKQWRLEAARRPEAQFKFSADERDGHFKELDFLGEDDIFLDDDTDPEHDFKAGFLFFQKHGIGWKKATYQGNGFDNHEKFPNQKLTVHKALYDTQHNPIYETKDEDDNRYLKYIHLPANHMGWVEVSIPTNQWRVSLTLHIQASHSKVLRGGF
jgi:hypothetical protein